MLVLNADSVPVQMLISDSGRQPQHSAADQLCGLTHRSRLITSYVPTEISQHNSRAIFWACVGRCTQCCSDVHASVASTHMLVPFSRLQFSHHRHAGNAGMQFENCTMSLSMSRLVADFLHAVLGNNLGWASIDRPKD